MARKTPKAASKAAYLARRMKKVRELYVRDGLEPRDIAARLVTDGTIETSGESLESAIRLVRSDVAVIRAEINGNRSADGTPALAANEIDAIERELTELREQRDEQKRISKDFSTVHHTTVTGAGPIVAEIWSQPPGIRQKASKDAALLAKDISKLEQLLATKRNVETEPGESAGEGGLTIIESDKSIPELIEKNLRVN